MATRGEWILMAIGCVLSTVAFGQTSLKPLFEEHLFVKPPYASQSNFRERREVRKILHGADSLLLIKELERVPSFRVNPYGGTGFGDLDGMEDESLFEQLFGEDTDLTELSLYSVIPIDDFYLVHIGGREDSGWGYSYRLLAKLDKNGVLQSWLFSDGPISGGNPNGNISREMSVIVEDEQCWLHFSEGAWGRNTETYSFEVTFYLIENEYQDNVPFEVRSMSVTNRTLDPK